MNAGRLELEYRELQKKNRKNNNDLFRIVGCEGDTFVDVSHSFLMR